MALCTSDQNYNGKTYFHKDWWYCIKMAALMHVQIDLNTYMEDGGTYIME